MADQEPSNKQKHKHPGGAGAVLGVRVMRNSSVQGADPGGRQRHAARLDPGRRLLPRPQRAGPLRPADVPRRPHHPDRLAARASRAPCAARSAAAATTTTMTTTRTTTPRPRRRAPSAPGSPGPRARGPRLDPDLRPPRPDRRRAARRRHRGREPGRARRPAVGRPGRLQDLRHHALARAPPGRLPDLRHGAPAARARRADGLPGDRLGRRRGDDRDDRRHRGRRRRRPDPADRQLRALVRHPRDLARSSSAAATAPRS